MGIVDIEQALTLAGQSALDLVEIVPNADPPVCRIMDMGKFKYERGKKNQQAKKKQKQTAIKEIKFRPGTEEADYQVKLRNLRRFLSEGDKAKITLRFRGREMAHQELGSQLLNRIEADLTDYGKIEQHPKLEGRQMVMVISPHKKQMRKAT